MKFPSIIRLPRHKRFNFEPRYYDPIKEDIENRIAQIKSEMTEETDTEFKSSIEGAFRRNRTKHSNAGQALLQLLIFAVLLGGFVGWLFYGNVILYLFAAFIPVYLFLRLRRSL